MNSRRSSFDHLVGAGEQRRRHCRGRAPGGLVVDDQLELARLHHRQVGGLFTFENAAGIAAGLTPRIRNVGSVAHQPADFGQFAVAQTLSGSRGASPG